MTLKITAGKDNVPMPPITLPPIRGDETIEELEAMVQPQVHAWMIEAYPEHKILETIVKLSPVEQYLYLSIDIRVDTEGKPAIIQGIGYDSDGYRQEGALHVYPRSKEKSE